MRKKKPSKSRVINKNDELSRQLNKQLRKNTCERCGRSGDTYQLQWCHIYGRRAKSMRWDMDNCHLFCSLCHRWQGEYPLAYSQWFVEKYGIERKKRLQEKYAQVKKHTVEDYLRIQQELKDALEATL